MSSSEIFLRLGKTLLIPDAYNGYATASEIEAAASLLSSNSDIWIEGSQIVSMTSDQSQVHYQITVTVFRAQIWKHNAEN